MENFTKFEQTAPDYTPPEEAFSAFESNIEALAAKAAPANEGPKAGGAANEGTSAGSNEPPPKKNPPDFDKEATLEWMGIAA